METQSVIVSIADGRWSCLESLPRGVLQPSVSACQVLEVGHQRISFTTVCVGTYCTLLRSRHRVSHWPNLGNVFFASITSVGTGIIGRPIYPQRGAGVQASQEAKASHDSYLTELLS